MHHRPIEWLETRRLLALVIDYPMEEGSGATVHDVASDFMPQDAELTGGARWIDTGGQTIFGQHGIELDGVDDALRVSEDIGPVVGFGSGSVTAWIKTSIIGGSMPQESPGMLGGDYGGEEIYWGWIDDCGRINFSVPGATPKGGRDTVRSTFPVNDGRWYHIGMTRDGASGEIRLYVNGLLQDSALADPSPRDGLMLHRIGVIEEWDAARPDRYLGASIDRVHIYDEALSAGGVGLDFDPSGAPPMSPTNVRVTLVGSRAIRLSWDPVVGASGYEVWRSIAGEDDFQQVAVAPPKDGFTDRGLEPNTAYQYRIRTVQPFGNSAFSPIITASTTELPNHAPLFIQGTAGDDLIRVEQRGQDLYVWNSADRCCSEPYHVEKLGDFVEIEIHTGEGNDRVEVDVESESYLAQPIWIYAGPGRDEIDVSGKAQYILKDNADADDLTAAGGAMLLFDGDQQFDSWTFEGPVAARLYESNVAVRTITTSAELRIDIDRGTLGLLDSPQRDLMLGRLDELARASRASSPPWSGPGLTSSAIDSPLETLAVGIVTKVTYAGDVNADGKVDGDDYFAIDSGFLEQPADPLYGQGDFNYDGKVNADDYFLIDIAFLGQQPATATESAASTSVRSSDTRSMARRKSGFSTELVRSPRKGHVRDARKRS